MWWKKFALAALLCSAQLAPAAAGELEVRDAWARATVAGQEVGGVYLTLSSPIRLKLIGAKSPVAKGAELHWMAMRDGVMKMGRLQSISILAGEPLELKPGGSHIMLVGLKQPLQVGDRVPLTLTLKRHDNSKFTLEVQAEVRPVSGESHHHDH